MEAELLNGQTLLKKGELVLLRSCLHEILLGCLLSVVRCRLSVVGKICVNLCNLWMESVEAVKLVESVELAKSAKST